MALFSFRDIRYFKSILLWSMKAVEALDSSKMLTWISVQSTKTSPWIVKAIFLRRIVHVQVSLLESTTWQWNLLKRHIVIWNRVFWLLKMTCACTKQLCDGLRNLQIFRDTRPKNPLFLIFSCIPGLCLHFVTLTSLKQQVKTPRPQIGLNSTLIARPTKALELLEVAERKGNLWR